MASFVEFRFLCFFFDCYLYRSLEHSPEAQSETLALEIPEHKQEAHACLMWLLGVYRILSECLTLTKIKRSHVKMQVHLRRNQHVRGCGRSLGGAGYALHTALGPARVGLESSFSAAAHLCFLHAETELQMDEMAVAGVTGRSWGQSQAWGPLP